MENKKKSSKGILVLFVILILILASIIVIYQNNESDPNNGQILPPENNFEDRNITITKKITFSEPNLQKNGIYLKIIDEKATSFTMEEENIRVPVYTETFQLPLGTEIFNFSFEHSDIKTIILSNNIKPISYPISTLSLTNNKIFYLNKNDNSEIYPSGWYTNSSGGGIYNKNLTKFFNIHIFPQRYSKKEKTLYYIKDAIITFTYENISNNKTNNTYDYLIITPKEFQTPLQTLIQHKEDMGLKPIIVNLDEIYKSKYFKSEGRDSQEKIKYFIKNAIEHWDTKYVFLVGDHEKIPVRYIHTAMDNNIMSLKSISDLYYSDIYFADGSFSSWDTNNNNTFGECNWKGTTEKIDFYPDVYLGRIPCKKIEDVTRVVNKIIKYETTTNKKEWFNEMILCGGDTFPPLRSFLSLSHLRLLNMIYLILHESNEIFYEEGTENCEIISEIMNDFNHKKIYSYVIKPEEDYKPLLNMYITQAIDEGAGFLYFAGHGNPTAYATYKTPAWTLIRERPILHFTTTQVAKLKNNEKLPVVILDACSCGKFDGEKCIAWDFVNMDNGGAIATYACTNLSFGRGGSYNAEGLNGFMSIKVFENYEAGFNQPGIMLAHAQIDYQNQISKLEYIDYLIISIWELFGDPSLIIG
jgi:hypothetical protein